ncbi:PaaI family thioesterase [Pontibacter ruber]|uniref:PaaI family thioesterase n=1 Tax=Pontibacter ruber TaxID=1343895 RepID=A0ABW5CZ98_9BACT|nr:PaaI family thioesterase [Pontibacter ruber]
MATQQAPAEAFRNMVTSPAKFRLFLLSKLPMAYLAGLRISSLTDERATVTIPYKYLTKNPFGSIYFACLSMAAELSTGVLCMMHVYKSEPPVSMLVVGMDADFTRKAVGVIRFSCEDGRRIQEAVDKAKATGEGQTVTVTSTGTDETGAQVASFRFTWSFKAKSKKQV